MTGFDGSLAQLANSATFPAWVAALSAAVFGTLFIAAMLRADRTPANAALAALTFVGLAVLTAIGLRGDGENPGERTDRTTTAAISYSGIPALACVDDLAGEATLAACEKSLFKSPDIVAAAVGYTAQRINRLVALSASPQAERVATPDEQALRNAIERDRYGLVAYVLTVRDKCQPKQCAAFAAMTDHQQVSANMESLIYEGLVARYAPGWSANEAPPMAGLPTSPGVPTATGRPSTIDFPTADQIPPVSIMTEQPARPAGQSQTGEAGANAPPAAAGGPYVPARQGAAPKRPAAQKRAPAPAESPAGPVQIVPQRSAD